MVYSPYLHFARKEWCHFRDDMPLTLDEHDLQRLQGANEPISLQEIQEIYLPLSRLLSLYVCATQALHQASQSFLGKPSPKLPYLIGIAGSVAVGKSTCARVLKALLSRWPNHPKVSLVTTDGFLYPLAELKRRGLLDRKGFPESYDTRRLVSFLAAIKSGSPIIYAPLYSHHLYDIILDEYVELNNPDIVIVEGLNILQTNLTDAKTYICDFFDFTIFVDAETSSIKQWFIDRVLQFQKNLVSGSHSLFSFHH